MSLVGASQIGDLDSELLGEPPELNPLG